MTGDGFGIALVETQQIAPNARIQIGGLHVIGERGLLRARRTAIHAATTGPELRTLATAAPVRAEIAVRARPATALTTEIGIAAAETAALAAVTVTTTGTIRAVPRLRPPTIVVEGTGGTPAIAATETTVVTTGTIALTPRPTTLTIGATRVLTSGPAAVPARRTIPVSAIITATRTARSTGITPISGPTGLAAITPALPVRSTPETTTVIGIGSAAPETTLITALRSAAPETPLIAAVRTTTPETTLITAIGTTTPETTTVAVIGSLSSETTTVAALPTVGTTATGAACAIPGATVLLVRAIRFGAAGVATIGTGASEASTGSPFLTASGVLTPLTRRVRPTLVAPFATGPLTTAVAAERFATVVLLRHGGPFLRTLLIPGRGARTHG